LHELLQKLYDSYQQSLQTGGYPFIVLLMAMESSVVPIPSEVIIPPAVLLVMAGHSTMTLTGIVIASVIGCWVGATVMYWASRLAGRPLFMHWVARIAGTPLGKLLRLSPEGVEHAEAWSRRFGSFGIFLSRMLPVIRHLIGIPAGIVRMNFLKFSTYTVLGSLVWCTVLTRISVVAGNDAALMHGDLRRVTLWVTGAAVFLGGAYYLFVYRMSRKAA
jgi:membrane protein DedA with SNARE-associated domain